MPRVHLITLASAVLVLGGPACIGDDGVDRRGEALVDPGPWHIPPETLAIGDAQYVEYTGAGPWVGESGCGGGLLDGSAVLRGWIMANYPQVSSIGGYSCRPIVGASSTMSVHATGRALDVMIPLDGGEPDNGAGDPIGNWLIEHAQEIGIQYIIWDRWQWNASRSAGNKDGAYTGEHPHHDHLHVELSVDGAAMRTPWFSGTMEPPGIDACPALPAGGGVIEETSDCFRAYGPSEYWRSASAGSAGALKWTNAFQSATPSNWARWHLLPSAAGEYDLAVYADPAYAVHRATRYSVTHAGTTHDLVVDLSGTSGWLSLGVFAFDGGGGEHVSVYDHSEAAVAADQHIPADAVRLGPVGSPGPGPGPEPDPTEPTPGPRTIFIPPALDQVAVPGDAPIPDDDAYEENGLSGGCSTGASPAPSHPLLGALALAAGLALTRRRRARGARSPSGLPRR